MMYVAIDKFLFQMAVASETSDDIYYVSYGLPILPIDINDIKKSEGSWAKHHWSCTCNDWIYRKSRQKKDCKHIIYAKDFWHPVTEHDANLNIGKDGFPELHGDGWAVRAIFVPDEDMPLELYGTPSKSKIKKQRKRFV